MGLFRARKPDVPPHPRSEPLLDLPLSRAALEGVFGGDADFASRTAVPAPGRELTAVWLDGMTEGGKITDGVLRPLFAIGPALPADDRAAAQALAASGLWSPSARVLETMDEAAGDLVSGRCLLFFPTEGFCVSASARTENRRSIAEPEVESAVKGAKDSFTEELRVSVSLIRRRMRSPFLRVAKETVGRQTRTEVNVLWLEGLTDPALVEELRRRLAAIDEDGVPYTGNLEEYLADDPWSPFPQAVFTQRPDRLAAQLLAGRAAVLADGLPVAYAVPGTLEGFLRAPQDDSGGYLTATILTLLRYAAMALTLLLPAAYIAAAVFHPEMLPARLLASVLESRRAVPFGTAAEVVTMLLAFELLQEAGLRLPQTIGQSVSIIGGLIVGQSAVEARLVSPIVVIVVATAGVMGYTMPSQDFAGALRVWRFVLVLAASALGLFGLTLALAALIAELAGLTSFGVPYLAPFSSARREDSPLLRPPLPARKLRSRALGVKNVRKQG